MALNVQSRRHNISKWPGMLVIAGLLILGLFIYKDYGVSWDEADMRQIGEINLKFVRTGDVQMMEHFEDKDHGAAIELPLRWAEEPLGLKDFGEVIRFRHLACFLFYLFGLWAAYMLALRLFRRQWIALLGLSMLILQPRIFAHAFFNSKDIPFLVAIIFALNALFIAFEKRRIYLFVLAGLLCGFATGIRTLGLMLIVFVFLLLIVDLIKGKPSARRKVYGQLAGFLLSAMAMLYVSWPYLWQNPVQNLMYSVARMSHYSAWLGSLLFNGKTYPGTALPWYYLPEWFCISTPLVWLVLCLTGLVIGAVQLIKQRKIFLQTARQKTLLLCAAIVVVPIAAIILKHAVVYDDWRHVYFIYPPLIMIALYGVERLAKNKAMMLAIITASFLQIVGTGIFMVRAHPFQQVYFNPLVPHRPEYLRRHFDYEYWGTSYRYGIEYLLQHEKSDSIPVVRTFSPIAKNWQALTAEQRRRIRWTADSVQGAYLLTNFRDYPPDNPYPKVWSIKVAGSTVLQIYKVDTTLRLSK